MKKTKNVKLSKTAKTALQIFALFGGQGIASSRNSLSAQSSRKLPRKSVVYVNDIQSPLLPQITAKINQGTKSPLAAFTNKSLQPTQNAERNAQSIALDF